MKLAIISDIHVTEEVKEEAFESLDDTIPKINSHEPDLVIVLGDMIGGAVTTGKEAPEESEGVKELKMVKDRIKEIGAETLYLRGNHEQDITAEEFEKIFQQKNYGLKQIEGENFIYLDSSAPELSGSRGQISREQLDFLDKKLEQLEDAFLIIHHPIHFRDLSNSYFWDLYPERALCGNKKEINNVIENHSNIKAVFNSHIHDTDHTEFKGNHHFTNTPFISESRGEGFNKAYTIAEIEENLDVTVYDKEGIRLEWSV